MKVKNAVVLGAMDEATIERTEKRMNSLIISWESQSNKESCYAKSLEKMIQVNRAILSNSKKGKVTVFIEPYRYMRVIHE